MSRHGKVVGLWVGVLTAVAAQMLPIGRPGRERSVSLAPSGIPKENSIVPEFCATASDRETFNGALYLLDCGTDRPTDRVMAGKLHFVLPDQIDYTKRGLREAGLLLASAQEHFAERRAWAAELPLEPGGRFLTGHRVADLNFDWQVTRWYLTGDCDPRSAAPFCAYTGEKQCVEFAADDLREKKRLLAEVKKLSEHAANDLRVGRLDAACYCYDHISEVILVSSVTEAYAAVILGEVLPCSGAEDNTCGLILESQPSNVSVSRSQHKVLNVQSFIGPASVPRPEGRDWDDARQLWADAAEHLRSGQLGEALACFNHIEKLVGWSIPFRWSVALANVNVLPDWASEAGSESTQTDVMDIAILERALGPSSIGTVKHLCATRSHRAATFDPAIKMLIASIEECLRDLRAPLPPIPSIQF